MKTVCIVTITLGSNFGNRLQNYALQETLKRLGCHAETVKNMAAENKLLQRFPKLYPLLCKVLTSPAAVFAASRVFKDARVLKKVRFLRFNADHIQWSRFLINKNSIPPGFASHYDAYVCGSDQIWNPHMRPNSSVEYLAFVKAGAKIAYAASFGVSELPGAYLQTVRGYLRDFNGISVREAQGVRLLRSAGVDNARLVLDPVLLLSADEWAGKETKPSFAAPDNGYILYYNLKSRTGGAEQYVRDTAKANGWIVIDVLDRSRSDYYGVDPFEFLYLVRHAALVCTDSFHASVFSLLFHRQVHVFNRGNMSSRIDTLFDLAGIDDWRAHMADNAMLDQNQFAVFDQTLHAKRRESIAYLQAALSQGD